LTRQLYLSFLLRTLQSDCAFVIVNRRANKNDFITNFQIKLDQSI